MAGQTTGKETGFLRATHAHGAEVVIPVGTVKGRRDGPVACFVAGVHGAEYVGMEAVRRLFHRIDPEELRGTVRVVFIANLPAFHGRSEAICPVDGKNLNRVFPGKQHGGTYSDLLASLVFERVVQGSELVVDVHGGDIFEALEPYIALRQVGSEEVKTGSRRLAFAYGVEYVLKTTSLPGQGATGSPLSTAAVMAGIPAITAEAGGEGVLEEEFVQVHERGLLNVLREWGMLSGRPEIPVKPREMYSYFWRAQITGVFYPLVRHGEWVRAGQKVGEIRDYFGDLLQQVVAPYDAVIIAVVTSPATKEGSVVLQVGKETEE